jgi:dimethylargininase
MARTALVRPPGPRLAEGLVSHIERSPIDVPLARTQWDRYVAALQEAGWAPVEVPTADDCPDAVFVEDTMVVYGDLAIIGRSGAEVRRPEVGDAAGTVSSEGYRTAWITEPGTMDGGDVLRVGDTVYVGRSARTNDAGIEQIRALLEPLGAKVVPVPVTKVLHLKSAVTALPDGTVIGYEPLLDDPGLFENFVAVEEESGSHVVPLGERRLLIAASAPRTADRLRDLGWDPVQVDITEFEKLEGTVTCLSVRLE